MCLRPTWTSWGFAAVFVPAVLGPVRAAGAAKVEFQPERGQLAIRVGGQPFATYVHEHETITRPFFAHVRVPGGPQVTRNHPPLAGKDSTDHDTFHPGLWLAFGDLSGADGWRNKARVRHVGFAEQPRGGEGSGRFAVHNDYLSPDGKKTLCRETCRYTLLARPSGVLVLWDSQFHSADGEFAFGDQEEMGLGVRVATPLTVKNGGRLTTSDGDSGEKQVRGKTADWCDYSGTVEGKLVGVTLMLDPKNFRPCWYHARDYGLLVANPFGRKSLTGGEVSRVVVKKGETMRLRFGILIHSAPTDRPTDLKLAYKDFLQLLAGDK